MPTYFPNSTKVQLIAANLAKSTTTDLTQNKSSQARRNTEGAEKAIDMACALKESIIAPEDGGRIHFLGPYQDMPLLMVAAGAEPFKHHRPDSAFGSVRPSNGHWISEQHIQGPSSRQGSNQSTSSSSVLTRSDSDISIIDSNGPRGRMPTRALSAARNDSTPSNSGEQHTSSAATPGSIRRTNDHPTAEPALSPQALIIKIDLSDKSFVRSFDKNETVSDLAIDLFINGEFCHSRLVAARKRLDDAKSGLTQTFSGTRVHRLVERAWVICPPSQNPDGSLRVSRKSKDSRLGAEERWKQVAKALAAEADQRGFNKYGDRSPLGAYLASVSQMEMPDRVETMQKKGGPKFSVVDVVITYGKGMKFGPETDYLLKPARFSDSMFSEEGPSLEGEHQTGKQMPSERVSAMRPTPTAATFREAGQVTDKHVGAADSLIASRLRASNLGTQTLDTSENMSQAEIEESSSTWLVDRLQSFIYLSKATAGEAQKGPSKPLHALQSAQDNSGHLAASFSPLETSNELSGQTSSGNAAHERTILPQQRIDPSSTQSPLTGIPLAKRRLSQTLPTPALGTSVKRNRHTPKALVLSESRQEKETVEGQLGISCYKTSYHDTGGPSSPLNSYSASVTPIDFLKETPEVLSHAPPKDQQISDQNISPLRLFPDPSRDRSPPPSSPMRPLRLAAIEPPT
ncbi:hypothetical protein LTS18_003716, partial [Coniosporium uncinatum]